MAVLRQSTPYIDRLGPFVSNANGWTPLTGLLIGQADIQISKIGGAFAPTSDIAPSTPHDGDAWYAIPFAVNDVDVLGPLKVKLVMPGALQVWENYSVVTQNQYDSMFGSAIIDVNASQLGGIPQTGVDAGAVLTKQQAPSNTMTDFTCGDGATLTTINVSALLPSLVTLANQWNTKSIYFDGDTPTVGLRGVFRRILSHTAGATPTITVEALPVIPINIDRGTIV